MKLFTNQQEKKSFDNLTRKELQLERCLVQNDGDGKNPSSNNVNNFLKKILQHLIRSTNIDTYEKTRKLFSKWETNYSRFYKEFFPTTIPTKPMSDFLTSE